MKYQDLRNLVENWPKHEGCVKIERAPLITPGFPGTFNLSFTEDPWLKEYGRYVDFDHNYIFSTVQSCVRPEDLPRLGTQDSWKYLGVFEIADLTGILSLVKRPDYKKLQEGQIDNLIRFLEAVGIPKESVYPSYAKGGCIKEITQGKYPFDFLIPEDSLSKNAFLNAGIPERNILPDLSRDTFLCPFLRTSMPYSMPYSMPWGYRNEINIGTDSGKRLDVGTIEYILWKPRFSGLYNPKNILDIEEANFGVSLVAVGLERLCMVVNDLRRVQDVDYIKPFYEVLGNEEFLGGESLRAIHRIYSDITSYNCLPGRHQKEKIRNFIQDIPRSISREQIKDLLIIHTKTQPWHQNLERGIDSTLERISQYRVACKK
ncbi:hypothetical protein J4423_02720 [Candidatus Pacearchaeota archaeon]|nr:hypothetical protein [Candidatus Pacearchaeota archaeon]